MKFQVKDTKITDITPYGNNPKDHPQKSIEKIAESITKFGWQQPIVVDEHNVIIIGHGRFAAAQHMGLTTIPVKVAEGLSEEQTKTLRIADNKLPSFSPWNEEALINELDSIFKESQSVGDTFFSEEEYSILMLDNSYYEDGVSKASGSASPNSASGNGGGSSDSENSEEEGTTRRRAGMNYVFNLTFTDQAKRQIIYDAINAAKKEENFDMQSDALACICQHYLDTTGDNDNE